MNHKYERLEEIDVVRKEGNNVHVLGRSGTYECPNRVEPGKYLHHLTYDASNYRVIDEISFKRNEGSLFKFGKFFSFFGIGLPFLFYQTTPHAIKNRNLTEWQWTKVNEFQKANLEDLKDAIKDIKIYQGTTEEVEKELGVELKRIDTGKPETFIQGEDSFWLRVKAHLLGADAVVHYQPGSAIGTPVKYKPIKPEEIAIYEKHLKKWVLRDGF